MRLGQRLALTGAEDEFKQLADTFDLMLERLDAAFTSQKRFVANAAHELRTPLPRCELRSTSRSPSHTERPSSSRTWPSESEFDRAGRGNDRGDADTRDQRTRRDHTGMLDLATAAEDALDGATTTIAERKIAVDAVLDSAPAHGDRVLLERMIANLVENAVRHNQSGGWIWIRTYARDGSTVFAVVDTARKCRPSNFRDCSSLARASDRLDFREGVGLGLSIAEAIARAHDAVITASPRPGGGLQLSITLPN